MVRQISHLLYVGHSSERRAKLSVMLGLDAASDHRSLVLLPEIDIEPALPDLPLTDLYLLDISDMGQERPFTLLAHLKQHLPHIPVLILTTLDQEPLAIETVNRGADYYLIWEHLVPESLRHVLRLLLRLYTRRLPVQARPVPQRDPLLDDAATKPTEPLDSDAVLAHFLRQLEKLVAYDTAAIAFIHNDIATIVHIHATQPDLKPSNPMMRPLAFSVSKTANLRQLAETRQPLLLPDVEEYEGWITLPQSAHVRSWMGAPIIVRDQFVAMLDATKSEPNFYTAQDLYYLNVFAEHIAIVLHNTQLYEETRRQLEQLKVLHEVALLGVTVSNKDELFLKLTQIIGQKLFPDNFGVLLLDEKEGKLLIHPSYHNHHNDENMKSIPSNQGIVGHVVQTQRPYRSGDITNDPYYVAAQPEMQSQLAVPLILDERVLGVINTESSSPYAFSEQDEQLLVTLAGQLSNAIERSRLLTAERARRREAEMLRQAASVLNATLDLNRVLNQLLEQLEEVVDYDSAAVLMLQDDCLFLKAGRGLSPALVGQYFPADNVLAVEVMQTKRPLYLPDASQDGRFQNWGDTNHTRGWLGIPIISRDKVLGMLTIDNHQVNPYTKRHTTLAQTLADQAALAITNAQLYESTHSSAKELGLVTEILRILNATPVFEDVFPSIYHLLKQITTANGICLAILENDERWDCTFMGDDYAVGEKRYWTSFHINHFSGLDKLRAGQPHLINDLSQVNRSVSDQQAYETGYLSTAMIPLISKQLLGVVKLLWHHKNGVNEAQLPLLNQLANAFALAIERSRLFLETNRQAEQLELLNDLARQLSGQIDTQTLCQIVTERLYQALTFTQISVLLVDERREYIVLQASAGQNMPDTAVVQQRQPLDQSIIGQAAYSGEKLLVNDTRGHANFQTDITTRILSQMVLPLTTNDQVLGVLNIESDQPHAFSDNDQILLTLVADQLAVALEKARLFTETSQRTAELEAIGEISTMLRQSTSIDEILPLILDYCLKIAGASQGSIFLLEADSGDLVARWSVPNTPELMSRRYQRHQGITGYVATTGEIYVTNDLSNDPLAYFVPEELPLVPQIQGSIGLPLRAEERVVGVILLGLSQRRTQNRSEVHLLKAISDIAGSALDRAMMLETLEQRVEARTYELAQANERLQELDKLKTKFISDMSHELRTPITNLGLYVDLLQKGRPEKQAQYIEVLHRQIERLGHLMTDILSLSRLEMGQSRDLFAPVDFNQLVRQALDGLHIRIEESELNLTVALAPDLPRITGDKGQLSQLVNNLLTNAVNYTPAGGSIKVQTVCEVKDGVDGICFVVADTGHGIAKEEQTNIFQRFYRGQQVGQLNIPGTGLGLAIVQEVVNAHEGQLDLESAPGEGTTFCVWLPVGDRG